VRDAPIEEIRRIESENALQEEDEEDEDETEGVRKGVETADLKDSEHGTKVDGPEIVQ